MTRKKTVNEQPKRQSTTKKSSGTEKVEDLKVTDGQDSMAPKMLLHRGGSGTEKVEDLKVTDGQDSMAPKILLHRGGSSTQKVEDLKVTDGQDSMASSIEEVKNLEDLLGVKQSNPFQTTNVKILEERMQGLTLTDLQAFAVRIGILPSGNKLALKTKITKAFKSHAGAGTGYNIGWQKPLVDPSSDAAAEILRISRENF